MKAKEKTNVMRVLDAKKIAYESFSYEADPNLRGEEIAAILKEDLNHVFKTLVTMGKSKECYVFVIPVHKELDLKKAAKVTGEKSISMIKQKELLSLTGYVHGGCSPIGMKKTFKTFINSSVNDIEEIYVSAGRVGMQIKLASKDLIDIARCNVADVVE